MPDISLKQLLDAGVHFGHQTRRWNPKMKPYIFGEKNGIHIVNLQKTAVQLKAATEFVSAAVARGQKVLFVGTKRQASDIVAENARRSGQFHVTNRWLGGMLTNFKTVKGSIDRLNRLEKERGEGRFDALVKKERIQKEREIVKLKTSLGGIQEMTGVPGVLFVIDPKKEHIAITEARRLGIPIVAVVDTNCDPDGIQFVIPGNDDALKAIRLFTGAISDACIEGSQMAKDFTRREYASVGGEAFTGAPAAEKAPEVVIRSAAEEPVSMQKDDGGELPDESAETVGGSPLPAMTIEEALADEFAE